MSGTVIALIYGNGIDRIITQYLPSGPIQIWSAKGAGWYLNEFISPNELIADGGGTFYVIGSGSNSWRMDSVGKIGAYANWMTQKILVGTGSVEDVAFIGGPLAIYTSESLFICNDWSRLIVVNSSTCSVVPVSVPLDGQRKIVWTADPKAQGLNSLWVSGKNVFVNPKTLATNFVNLTGCILGCGMALVSIDEFELDFLPTMKTWTVVDDRTLK